MYEMLFHFILYIIIFDVSKYVEFIFYFYFISFFNKY